MQPSSPSRAPTAADRPVDDYLRSFSCTTLWTSIYMVLILALPLFSTYLLRWLHFKLGFLRKDAYRSPATVPYIFPILRSSVDFVFDPLHFIRRATFHNGGHVPVRVKIFCSEIFLIQGQKNIVSLFKQSSASTATYMHMFCLKNFFGMHKEPLSVYAADDSGDGLEPFPGSTTASHNRIDFLTHESLVKFFSGSSMSRMFERFNHSLANRLTALAIGVEWEEIPDFLNFIQMELSTAVLEAMTGPQLITQNPTFVADLFTYDSALATLSKGPPRFLAPGAHAIRDKMLFMIKRWYAYAREHFDERLVDPDGDYDPFWGSEHMRYRQKILSNVDSFDDDAIASSDLGLIWGTITNAIPCIFWALIHIYRHPTLVSQLRTELQSSINPPSLSEPQLYPSTTKPSKSAQLPLSRRLEFLFSTTALLQQPLLQSVYAETLRLYVRVYITRSPARSSLLINDYIFPQKSVLLASSDPAHFDSQVWNTRDGLHPLSQFWAHRFLVRRGDPDSGPLRRAVKAKDRRQSEDPSALAASAMDGEAPTRFSLSGLNGAWIPYGGGSRACPGRQFAKREILTTCAMILAAFDVEVLTEEKHISVQGGRYGLGAQKPVGKVRVRMRRSRHRYADC